MMHRLRSFYCALFFPIALISLTSSAQEPPTRKPEFTWVTTQDGTRLATDVYVPESGTPLPVLLIRSTYGREAFAAEGQRNDYVVVVQDVRGMGQSEGEPNVFYADGWRPGLQDGADTVRWIQKQPWCNGRIGTIGGSALGITQVLLAPATDGVSAQWIDTGSMSFYHDAVYVGGVFCKDMLERWLELIKQPHLVPVYKSHPYYDDFWRYYNGLEEPERIHCPAVFVGGWYDIFQQAMIDGFVAREERADPAIRGKNFLIMKWTSHGKDREDDYKLPESRLEFKPSKIQKAFFDYHLKGIQNALDGIPRVHYFVFGDDRDPGAPGNEWRSADTWPPCPTVETAFYLGPNGSLATTAPTVHAASASFRFDPKDPYPTHGGANLFLPSGAFDQRKYSTVRQDLLTFKSEPLAEPMEVIGRVRVVLYVSSDAPDTDFTAKLVDIFPEGDGREILVLENIRRVKLRNSFSEPAPLLKGPEEIVEVPIDLWSTAWAFNRGHRIGIFISSSSYPRWEVNPNTGADHPTEGGEMRVAQNTVHFGEAYPSRALLPIRQRP